MTGWCRVVGQLLVKEIRLEWRGRELVTLLLCNALCTAILLAAGVSSAMLDAPTTAKIFPMLLWVVFILASVSSLTRSYEHELEGRGFEGLLLAGVTPVQLYLSKVIVNTALFALNFVILLGILAVALSYAVGAVAGSVVLVGLGASLALSALTVVLGAVAASSKLRGVMVPLLAVPLVFPLFFSGIEMTTELILRGKLDDASPWPGILIITNALYLGLGINLYGSAVRE